MMLQLIKLELTKTMRSTSFAKSVLVAVFLGFLAVLLLSYLLILGLVLKEVIEEVFKTTDTLSVLNS